MKGQYIRDPYSKSMFNNSYTFINYTNFPEGNIIKDGERIYYFNSINGERISDTHVIDYIVSPNKNSLLMVTDNKIIIFTFTKDENENTIEYKKIEDKKEIIVEKTTSYTLNEKQKTVINTISDKINKMSEKKKTQTKNQLNEMIKKFKEGSKNYEIAKKIIENLK